VTLLFYPLFKPVNRSFSLLAPFFSLAGCAIQAVSSAFFLAPLVVNRRTNFARKTIRKCAELKDCAPPRKAIRRTPFFGQ